MQRHLRAGPLALLVWLTWLVHMHVPPALAEEGMFPMSELAHLDLRQAGLQIDPSVIYNRSGISMVNGIVKIGGCTGSFVSDRGLILTNHHCAFRALQAASSAERDYLRAGFLAPTEKGEIWAQNYTVRITESYRDVSGQVLGVVDKEMEPGERTRAIERRCKELELEAEKENPGMRAEVAEMFPGRSYVLFLYTWLRDVRLVHAPPRDIGEFGGEEDNWIWPRHTGDYAFMRAYVGPDGKPADHAAENVPYHPRTAFQVSPRGADAGDFVFLFGYPGRTYRHRTSFFLAYESERRLPWVVDWYGWQIDFMETRGRDDADAELRVASRLNGLWNTFKDYKGKLQGFRRLGLVDVRHDEESSLRAFIRADPAREARYGTILADIGAVYDWKCQDAAYDLWLAYLTSSPHVLNFAFTAYDAAHERLKPEAERESPYQDRNWPLTQRRLLLRAAQLDVVTDRAILSELFRRGGEIPGARSIPRLGELLGEAHSAAAAAWLDDAFASSRIHEEEELARLLELSTPELEAEQDPFIDLVAALYPLRLQLRDKEKSQRGDLDRLHALLLEAKEEFLGTRFVPDANGTLRFTYGRVRGYSPADGIDYTPQTTLRGVLQKNTGREPYRVPEVLVREAQLGDFGSLRSERLGDLPVCILYSADTSRGNSGSPVFDAQGRLVGLNFDRAWEATINDFAWDESYSRSIGVDIRYVLFLTGRVGGADRLLREMGLRL